MPTIDCDDKNYQSISVKGRVQSKIVQAASEHGILLVRTSDLPPDGLLSVRQRGWVNSAPYDSRTENPILYKLVGDHSCLSLYPPNDHDGYVIIDVTCALNARCTCHYMYVQFPFHLLLPLKWTLEYML